MPDDKFYDFLKDHFDRAEAATSPDERIEALRRVFLAKIAHRAELAIDGELGPIEGTPVEKPPYATYSEESAYHPYRLARQNGFAGFTDEQRAVLKGLVMHTAFEVMDYVFHKLDHFNGYEVGISLHDLNDESVHVLRSAETDQLIVSRDGIPEQFTKYEYSIT